MGEEEPEVGPGGRVGPGGWDQAGGWVRGGGGSLFFSRLLLLVPVKEKVVFTRRLTLKGQGAVGQSVQPMDC